MVEIVHIAIKFASERIVDFKLGEPIKFKPGSIKIEADWSDSASGAPTAKLFLRLYRGKEIVSTHDLFGVHRRDGSQKSKIIG